ncbi:MAG: hypothetical protein HQK51_00975 [Oligoflexia bacterium]|nr:hypothetical protein [Oligoflexia bacterium]
MKAGVLTLIPTPINELLPLESVAKEKIEAAIRGKRKSTDANTDSEINSIGNAIFVFEERSCAIKRWIRWGFSRDVIDDFYFFNEHNQKVEEVIKDLLQKLISGQDIFLMSDGGLPGFCDPGVNLINLAHKNKIKVTSTPFANSLMLAIVLSGFSYSRFVYEGFVPHKDSELRTQFLKKILKSSNMSIMMETPYRLNRLLDEIRELKEFTAKTNADADINNRQFFLALDLNGEKEKLLRGTIDYLCENISEKLKAEFVLVISEIKDKKDKIKR